MSFIKRVLSVISGSTIYRYDQERMGKLIGLSAPGGLGTISSIPVVSKGAYNVVPSIVQSGDGPGNYTVVPQMTANQNAGNLTIQNGGSGYVVGEVITLTGGTNNVPVKVTVNTVTAGVITSATITQAGNYQVLPTNPIAQGSTTGSGTGATFNIAFWGLAGILVTNGGTGYNSSTNTFTAPSPGGTPATLGPITVTPANDAEAIFTVTNLKGLPSVAGVPSYGVWVSSRNQYLLSWKITNPTNNSFTVVMKPLPGTALAPATLDLLIWT